MRVRDEDVRVSNLAEAAAPAHHVAEDQQAAAGVEHVQRVAVQDGVAGGVVAHLGAGRDDVVGAAAAPDVELDLVSR